MKKSFQFIYSAIFIWCLCQANEFDEINEKMQKAKNAIDNELASIGTQVLNAFETAKHENHQLAHIEREGFAFNEILFETLKGGFSVALPGLKDHPEADISFEKFTLERLNENPEIWFLPSTIKIIEAEVKGLKKLSETFNGIYEYLALHGIVNREEADGGNSANFDPALELIRRNANSLMNFGEVKKVMKKFELFEESLKIRQRGAAQMTKCIGGEQIKKFESYAKLVRLQKVHDAAVEMYNALEAFVNNKNKNHSENLFDLTQEEKNIKLVEKQFNFVQIELRNLFPKFMANSETAIDMEMAERLVKRDETAYEELNEDEEVEGAFFTKLELRTFLAGESQNEYETAIGKSKILKDKFDLLEWEMLVNLAHLLRLYFVVDKYGYLPAMYRANAAAGEGSSNSGTVHKHHTNLEKMLDKNTIWFEWLKLSQQYVQNSPMILKDNNIEKLPNGFAGLLLNPNIVGFYWQLPSLYEMMKEEMDKNKPSKSRGLGLSKEVKQKLDKLVKIRTLIWPAILLHIALQHWYVEPKNVVNAEIVIDTYKVLNKVFEENGINKGNPIDKELAKRLSESREMGITKKIFKEFFGEKYDYRDIIKVHQSILMANIGKLLNFYYSETLQ